MFERPLIEHIAQRINQELDGNFHLIRMEKVDGGDSNSAWTLHSEKKHYFLKINTHKPQDFFLKESNGLKLLAATQHGLHIPKPYFSGHWEDFQYLLMEHLDFEEPATGFAEKLGRGLAELHRNTNDFFGLSENNYIGSQPQENTPTKDWPSFYADNRILPQSQRAFDNGYFTKSDLQATEQLCLRFSDLFPTEKPSLLHGDLWNGNYACLLRQKPSIFDPAIYYGHREIDIAMTLLFGGFDIAFYKGYNETFPLQEGWKHRIGLFQLYPLLMHLNHFGMGYYRQVKKILYSIYHI